MLHFVAGYWALTKPKVNLLIATTVVAGFCAARHTTLQSFPYVRLLHALLGTLLVASGAGVLNQVIERPFDARMRRTPRRPLVSGSISPNASLWFGVSLAIGGVIYLALAINLVSSCIAALTITSYLFLYTPLKRRTPLCTFVGALSGATPPLIGWAAASGSLSSGAWALYLMLFFWQFPHFMAIAWVYRHDYDRAGYKVLPRCKRRRKFIGVQSVIPALLLVLVSAIPTLDGNAGPIGLVGAMLLSSMFLFYAVRLAVDRSNRVARQLLFASIVYLPSVLLLMLLDKK
jgi:protoheme IX farnesyltransferase